MLRQGITLGLLACSYADCPPPGCGRPIEQDKPPPPELIADLGARCYGPFAAEEQLVAPSAVELDVDRDGFDDLVEHVDRTVLLRRAVPGGFAAPTVLGETDTPGPPVVGDIAGDGDDDLVFAIDRNVTVMLNDGSGTLSIVEHELDVSAAHKASAVALADLDGDGAAELALASRDGVGVWAVDPAGMLGEQQRVLPGVHAKTVSRVEVDGDDEDELLVRSAAAEYGHDLPLLLDGGETLRIALPPLPYASAIGDFDGDGLDDVAIPESDSIAIYALADPPRELARFRPAIADVPELAQRIDGIERIALARIDGDETTDFVAIWNFYADVDSCGGVSGSLAHIWMRLADGREAALEHTVGYYEDIGFFDLDDDGWVDLVADGEASRADECD